MSHFEKIGRAFSFNEKEKDFYNRLALASALLTIGIGIFVISGWIFKIAFLIKIFSAWAEMVPSTAIGFILAGMALFFRIPINSRKQEQHLRVFSQICAFLVIFIGFLTLFQYLFQWNLGIDQLFFQDIIGDVSKQPDGRMAPNTAFNFILLGVAFFFPNLTFRKQYPIAQIFALLAASIAFLSVTLYFFAFGLLSEYLAYCPMAFHTAIAFILLSLGFLFLTAEEGWMSILTHRNVGGQMARRLLPFVLFIPIALGFLRLQGEKMGLYSNELGVAIYSLSTIFLLIALIWWTANSLNKIDDSLKRESRLLSSIVNSIGDGVAVANSEGNWVSFNPAAERIVGVKAPEIPPEEWSSYFGVFYPDSVTPFPMQELPIIQAIQGKETNDIEQFIRNETKPDGVYLNVTGRPLMDENQRPLGGVVVFRDITQQKHLQKEMEILNESLAKHVSDLEVANKGLESFSYSVSHDLRAPLRGIMGFSRALLDEYQKDLPSQAQEYLIRVTRAAKKMGQMIDGLLDLTRLTRQEMVLEKIDLSEIARDVIVNLQQIDPSRKVNFVIKPDLVALGDEKLLYIVISNLLGNAWKFSAKKCPAEIEFDRVNGNERPAFFVRDNGVGFEMQYADQLFGAFQRLHSVQEFEGTGIGLATVQRIIQRHGGQIWVESRPDQGTTFYFNLG